MILYRFLHLKGKQNNRDKFKHSGRGTLPAARGEVLRRGGT